MGPAHIEIEARPDPVLDDAEAGVATAGLDDELTRLRRLLLSPQDEALAGLHNAIARLEEPEAVQARTEAVLIDALSTLEETRGPELAKALAPIVASSIRREIENSRDAMVDALYPITGRLVSAAVTNAIRKVVTDLNARFDRTLSPRSLKLRAGALLTRRSPAELALLEANATQVEHVLWIERASGLAHHAWHASNALAADKDLVSGLLAAISQFANEAIADDATELRAIDLNGRHVVLRGTPSILMAIVCTGQMSDAIAHRIDGLADGLVSLGVVGGRDVDDVAVRARLAAAQLLSLDKPKPHRRSALSKAAPKIAGGLALAGLLLWAGFAGAGWYARDQAVQRVETALAEAGVHDAYPVSIVTEGHAIRVFGLIPLHAAARVENAVRNAARPLRADVTLVPLAGSGMTVAPGWNAAVNR